MVNIEYANAYSEVLEILKYVSEEEYNKIPKEVIEVYEKNANKQHKFIYNSSQALDEQEVSIITKGIIAILFRDYWATDIQREKIIAKQNYERKILEGEKIKRYSPNSIFKNNENENKEVALIKIEKEKWYKKILNYFGTILKK